MIDLERARELLKMALETQGRDFVYNVKEAGCFYQPITELPKKYPNPDGSTQIPQDDPRRKTGCFIGTALDLHGETRHHYFPGRVGELARKYPDMMTDTARDYFALAQNSQDSGSSWGHAYDYAESHAEKYLKVRIVQ